MGMSRAGARARSPVGCAALPAALLCLAAALLGCARGLSRDELLQHGERSGDQVLPSGDDASFGPLRFAHPLFLYSTPYSELYVGTNGVLSPLPLPSQAQYVDEGFPTNFPAIAPFLADLATSAESRRGRVLFRHESVSAASTQALWRAGEMVRSAFPALVGFSPGEIVVVTWDQVGSYQEPDSHKANTFQAVVAWDHADTYALFLYPEDGVRFFGTRPRASFYANLELPARVGFSGGASDGAAEGRAYSLTSTEQSVKNLYQTGNSGTQGVWVFHIGSASGLGDIEPAKRTEEVWQLQHQYNLAPLPKWDLQDPANGNDDFYPVYTDETDLDDLDEHPRPAAPTQPAPGAQPPPYPETYPYPYPAPDHRITQSNPDPHGGHREPYGQPERHPERQRHEQPGEHGRREGDPQQSVDERQYRVQQPYHDPQPQPYHDPQPQPYHDPQPQPYHDPQPQPYPDQQPQPYPESQPQPYHDPQLQPYHDPQPQPYPDQQPQPYHDPQLQPYPESQPQPYHDPQPHPYPDQQPQPYPESQPQPYPEYQPQPYPESQPQPYPESQPQPYPDPQSYPESQPQPYHDPQPQPYHDPQSYPESQPQPYPESQPQPYPESQPQPYPDPQSYPESQPQPYHDPQPQPYHDPQSYPEAGRGDVAQVPRYNHYVPPRQGCDTGRAECSPLAECTEHATGFCCHCRVGHLGNGKDCFQDGHPQRVNGKVRGRVSLRGVESELAEADLHAYVVSADGRVYVAVSRVPPALGWALQLLPSLASPLAWLYSPGPGGQRGFGVAGGRLVQRATVTFSPGGERLHVTQRFSGLDPRGYLAASVELSGSLPHVEPLARVDSDPYTETYHQTHAGSMSVRSQQQLTVTANGEQTSLVLELTQNLTYDAVAPACARSGDAAPPAFVMERVFALYNPSESVLRYSITGRRSAQPERPPAPPRDPCAERTHGCGENARCLPGAGPAEYRCECLPGFDGDGRYCYERPPAPPRDPCAERTHGCGENARCLPGAGPAEYRCECLPGFDGDGRYCYDVDECRANPCGTSSRCENFAGSYRCGPPECPHGYQPTPEGHGCADTDECQVNRCGPYGQCENLPGSYRCHCSAGYQPSPDGYTCIEQAPPSDPCRDGRNNCAPSDRARCLHVGGEEFTCICLPGYWGNGHRCDDVDECVTRVCHNDAACHNTPGSFACHCSQGYDGDGFNCAPVATEAPSRQRTPCEQWRDSVLGAASPRGPRPPIVGRYVPQCDEHGAFRPVQCHGSTGNCWCVTRDGQEVAGTRSPPGSEPPCLPTSAPPVLDPTTRPVVHPGPPGTQLLYAQGQQIGTVPLHGTSMNAGDARILVSVHGSVNVGIDFDCVEGMVYWTDVVGRTINRVGLRGGEPQSIIATDLMSPEGLAIDHLSRNIFWVDSGTDRVEVARLDGSSRRTLVTSDLVNPRAIVADPVQGMLYWTDWNREGPKIESAHMDGTGRHVLVGHDIGLPNGLTFDPATRTLCWVDAGTKRLECVQSDGTARRVLTSGMLYPFSLTRLANYFYYTDWKRDGVRALRNDGADEVDEFLPGLRTHPYGITIAQPHCPPGQNHCGVNNGGCSHLCVPKSGGRSCLCPDTPSATERCSEVRQ
ncbi:nidogen-2-like [Lampetra fluviatilis]